MVKINKLKDMYINDTMIDGQKFCGCRIEDCIDFNKVTKCRKCLDDYIVEREKKSWKK